MKEDEEGRLTEHSRGMGTVTRSMVLKRAREIAIINGRSDGQILPGDFQQAQRELTGRDENVVDPEAPRQRAHSELRETVRGTRGRMTPRMPAHDEQTDAEKLVEEGVMDAEHDKMVEGTRDSLRREQE